jgi:hypothetical protein
MSRSHFLLRALFALSSLGLVGLVYAAGGGTLLVAVPLVLLTAWVLTRPESVLATLLVVGHGIHWAASAPVPEGWVDWTWLLLASWLVLLLHLSASAAVTWPSVAPVPPAALRRWGRRAGLVALATVPVWAVAAVTRDQSLQGEASMTYVALAGLTLLGGGLYLVARQSPLTRR